MKLLITILTLAVALSSKAQVLGVDGSGFYSDNGTPTFYQARGLGGWQQRASKAEMLNMPTPLKEVGMLCYVAATDTVYQLTDVATWTPKFKVGALGGNYFPIFKTPITNSIIQTGPNRDTLYLDSAVNIRMRSVGIGGVGGLGVLTLNGQSAIPGIPTLNGNSLNLFSFNGSLGWIGTSGNAMTFTRVGWSGSHIINIPDTSGTMILTTNVANYIAGAPVYSRLTADFPYSNATGTYGTVPSFSAAYVGNANYEVKVLIRTGCNGTGGIILKLQPTPATTPSYYGRTCGSNTAASGSPLCQEATSITGNTLTLNKYIGTGFVEFVGTVQTNNPGTMQVQILNAVSTETVTAYTGSYIMMTKLQ